MQDNQDQFDDPSELASWVEDRDSQLRETVLTIIMKHDVAAIRELEFKPLSS